MNIRHRYFCTENDCDYSTVRGKCLQTHLQIEHQYSETTAITKRAASKANAVRNTWVGADFNGTIHIVYIDTETTGLIVDDAPLPSIVELAAQTMDGKFTFSHLINPYIPIPQDATEIHTINNEMVQEQPPFRVRGVHFVEWVESFCGTNDLCVFVAHNGRVYDQRIILNAMTENNIKVPQNWRFTDSIPVIKQKLSSFARRKYVKLSDVHVALFGTPPSEVHRAMADVETLAKIFNHLFKDAPKPYEAIQECLFDTNHVVTQVP